MLSLSQDERHCMTMRIGSVQGAHNAIDEQKSQLEKAGTLVVECLNGCTRVQRSLQQCWYRQEAAEAEDDSRHCMTMRIGQRTGCAQCATMVDEQKSQLQGGNIGDGMCLSLRSIGCATTGQARRVEQADRAEAREAGSTATVVTRWCWCTVARG
jgi:hypothetical protein